MASLLEIKNKINSTKSTKKITKAMQLVAASKMKTFQKTSMAVRDFATDILHALELCGTGLDAVEYASVRNEGKTLFVLLTSDKGLCGAMNARLIRALFRSNEWKVLSEDERLLITIGRKSTDAAKNNNLSPIATFKGLKEDLEAIDALEVIDAILAPWLDGRVKKVHLIAPEYVNPFVFHVRLRQFLPLTQDRVKDILEQRGEKESKKSGQEAAFFEPNRDEVIETLAQKIVETLFMEAFFQLKATEYSSRMVAMKKATDAADDRIKALTNVYNKARQNAITQQLSELAAANEAMSTEHHYEIQNV